MSGRPLRLPRRARPPGASSLAVIPLFPALVVLVLLASACIPPRSGAPVDVGTIVFDSSRAGPNFEIFTMAGDGSNLVQLTSDATYDSWWPRLSPDRLSILFYRTPAGVHDHDYARTELWAMGADGTGVVQLRAAGEDGWHFQGHGGWSPDGMAMVMFGGQQMGPQLYVTDARGEHPALIEERPGTNVDPAYTADGRIVFIGCAQAWCERADYEVFLLDPASGAETRITNDRLRDHDPSVSTDGQRVAWLTEVSPGAWDLKVAAIDGSGARRVFGTGTLVGAPVWVDATHFLVHKVVPPGGFQIHRVDAVTLGVTNLTPNWPGSNEYPAG
jgi:Tol biopolymer transport system component